MNILLSGAAGFIGTNLCKYLLYNGHKVFAVDNFITSDKNNITQLQKNKNFNFREIDITSNSFVNWGKYLILDQIYHLACPTGVPNLTRFAKEMLLTSSIGTLNIVKLSKYKKIPVLFTSSSESYGNCQVSPQREDYNGNVDPVGIRSPYEEGKRFAESLCAAFVRKFNLNIKIVRIFNTYGPYFSLQDLRVIPRFLLQAATGNNITVTGEGSQKRTFCYVDDLISGLLTIMMHGKSGEVYNIGSDTEITIIKLAYLVRKITQSKSKIVKVSRPDHDHNMRLPDLTKIRSLAWKPKITLGEGIKKTYQFLLANQSYYLKIN